MNLADGGTGTQKKQRENIVLRQRIILKMCGGSPDGAGGVPPIHGLTQHKSSSPDESFCIGKENIFLYDRGRPFVNQVMGSRFFRWEEEWDLLETKRGKMETVSG